MLSIESFIRLFESLGYATCEDDVVEDGFEKIALYAGGDGMPTHAARQLPTGQWTSKLGFLEDIEHALHDLEGTTYGSVVQVLRREAA